MFLQNKYSLIVIKLDDIMNSCELVAQRNRTFAIIYLSAPFLSLFLPFSTRGNNYSNFCKFLKTTLIKLIKFLKTTKIELSFFFFVVFKNFIIRLYTYTTYCLILPVIKLLKNGVFYPLSFHCHVVQSSKSLPFIVVYFSTESIYEFIY